MQNLQGQLYVSGRDIRVDFQDGISVQRITKPYSQIRRAFSESYSRAFPVKDQREPEWRVTEIIENTGDNWNGYHDEAFVVATTLSGKVVGGNVFDYMEGRLRQDGQGKPIAFGVYWYLFSDESYRGSVNVGDKNVVIATKTHEANVQILQHKAAERGAELDALVMEMERPKKGLVGYLVDRVVRRQRGRLAAAAHLGFKAVDPKQFGYIQPALTDAQTPLDDLTLLIKPLRQEWKERISIEEFEQFLHIYVWGGFAGIKGSNTNGHRNPDTDESYKRMKAQLYSMRAKGETHLNLVSPLAAREN